MKRFSTGIFFGVLFNLILFPDLGVAEPELRYYLLGGASAVGGAKGGQGLSAGAVSTECNMSFCSGYAQLVHHTIRSPSVTSADTLKGYSLFGVNAFAGLGMRTTESKKLIGQVTYGFGFGPVIISIRRYTENSQKLTEAALSAFMLKGF